MIIKTAAIIGAGMAGLTAALALAKRGVTVHVLEQAPYLAEVGAGLQVSPNAARILGKLGVLSSLESVWNEPDRVSLSSGRSLKQLGEVPVGRFARDRWKAPYGVLHRATLQNALMVACNVESTCTFHLGKRIESCEPEHIESIIGVVPDLVIGADGVWSSVRSSIPGAPEPDFSGNIAWRFTVPFAEAPDFINRKSVQAFLGFAAHAVSYPLAETQQFNIVAIASGISPGQTWNAHSTPDQKKLLLAEFAGWHPAFTGLLKSAEEPRFWPLYQVSDGKWTDYRSKILIGDAAHAMMPFAAQGAAMAIEDAWELAAAVSSMPLATALAEFEKSRNLRVARVRKRGNFNQFIYHARGPLRLGRDLVLSLRPPQSLAADLDWLYGYEPKHSD